MFGKVIMRGLLVAAVMSCAVAAQANVLHMGSGLTSLEIVPVGDPGNAGELSGSGSLARVCGAVDYTYNIGKYEVTAGQYTEFLNAVARADTYALYNTNMMSAGGCKIQRSGSSGNYTYSVASDYANRPVDFVSWGDAARFANWLHNGQLTGAQNALTTEDGAYYLNGAVTKEALLAVSRETDWKWAVTSEDEWYKAAYYKGGGTNAGYWDYPTSSDTQPGWDLADVSGNNANYHLTSIPWPIDSGKYYTTVAGEFQNSHSAYGTFDQGGNLWEWNEANLANLWRGLRGGAHDCQPDYLLASLRGYYSDPTGEFTDIGFRVANVPEPGSLAMLAAIAAAGLLCCWRKHA